MLLLKANIQATNCIPSGTTITLTRQSEVDSFPINYPGCDIIDGYLTISGNDIVNLNGLIGLKRINGYLKIKDNQILNNLKGLDSIHYITYFEINKNNSLLDFDGLNNLDTVFNFEVNGNNNIYNFNGLKNLVSIVYFYVANNIKLKDFKGLDSLKKIGTRFNISNNIALLSFNGLNVLNFIWSFEVNTNDNLTNFNGLKKLDAIENFTITNNIKLKDFNGLDSLKKIGTSFDISNNISLLSFNGLKVLNFVWGFGVYSNPLIIDFTGMESLRYLEQFTIDNNNSLKNFKGLDGINQLHQTCYLNRNNSLQNFIGFQNVQKFNSTFSIVENPSIQNFSGLENVKYIGSLEVLKNQNLENFTGLNNLDTVPFSFQVNDNPKLKNFDGLQNFTKMGYAFFGVQRNLSLCSVNELNNNLILENPIFIIKDNPNLSCCKIIDTILKNNPTTTNIKINNNSPGCNDTTEIRTFPNNNCCSEKYTFLKDTICQGETFLFDNKILTTSGTYYDTIVVASIDSIIILQLIVRPKSYQIVNKNLCVGQQFTLSSGKIITTNGTYKDTIPNFCDSIIEYRVSFVNNIIVNQNATVCQGKNYILPKGNSVNSTGIYKDTLRASFGCDSIIITNLTITKPTPFINNINICKGKKYTLPNGNIVSNSGTYFDTIRKPNTCDSIVITNLTVNPYLQSSQTSIICLGKTYTLPTGKIVTQSGIYKDTIQDNNGCDSIVTTNLTFTNPIPFLKKDSICDGQSYTLPSGKIVAIAGVYNDTIKRVNSCDSIIKTTLSVFPNTFSVQLNVTDSIDAGNSLELKPTYKNDSATIWNWSPANNLSCIACENPIANPAQNSVYIVKATTQNGCQDTAKTTIVVKQVEVYIPTAFSPNNDGVNDELTVFVNNPISFHIAIYNRYSELLFESNSVDLKWNGKFKNEDQLTDDYTYILDVVTANGKLHHKQGIITLVR